MKHEIRNAANDLMVCLEHRIKPLGDSFAEAERQQQSVVQLISKERLSAKDDALVMSILAAAASVGVSAVNIFEELEKMQAANKKLAEILKKDLSPTENLSLNFECCAASSNFQRVYDGDFHIGYINKMARGEEGEGESGFAFWLTEDSENDYEHLRHISGNDLFATREDAQKALIAAWKGADNAKH